MLHDMGAANVDAVDENGDTALMVACMEGHVDSMKYLCVIKADLSVRGKFGTALNRAASGGHTEILKVTLRW